MLFEKLVELLTALAVAAAGLAGLDTAADHATTQANEAAVTNALERAGDVLGEREAVGPADGLAQAADSLTQAKENAPETADDGLDRAIEAVTTSPANDAPAGPPADLPGGRP